MLTFLYTVPTPAPPPPPSGGGGCFPASGNVLLENGKIVSISEVQIGDMVQTGRHFLSIIISSISFFPICIQFHQIFMDKEFLILLLN